MTDNSYNEGYECGMADGIFEAEDRIKKELEYELENEIERSHKDGFTEAENYYYSKISHLRSNSEQAICSLNSKIKELKRTIYNLRKENATITRSIQKSTGIR